MNSSLFNLQTENLLDNITPDYTSFKNLEKSFWSIKEKLEKLPEKSVSEIDVDQFAFPVDIPKPSISSNLVFCKPNNVRVVGSFMWNTVVKSDHDMNADLIFEMPSALFEEKDHLNYLYFYKKALYLRYIQQSLVDYETSVKFLGADDELFPALVLASNDMDNFSLRLIPTIKEDLFKISRLLPDRNSVRPYLFDESLLSSDPKTWPPTPIYNSRVLMDMSHQKHLNFAYYQINKYPIVKQVVMLIKVWLRQRQLEKLGFDSHVATLLTCWLFSQKLLNHNWSAVQCLRVILNWLSTANVKMSLNSSVKMLSSDDTVEFIDPTGRVNLFSRMTSEQFKYLKYSADVSLNFFDENGFSRLFLQKFTETSYDLCIKVETKSIKKYDLWQRLDFHDLCQLEMRRIESFLAKGLGKRIRGLRVTCKKNKFEICLILNPEFATKTIDFGPSAQDDAASREFQRLWGEKTELRRFPDGTIMEAVIWPLENNSIVSVSQVVEDSVTYLLNRHLQEPKLKLIGNTQDLFSLIRPSVELKQISSFLDVQKRFDEFSRRLKEIRDLPLTITDIRPASPALSSTSMFLPVAEIPGVFSSGSSPQFCQSLNVVLQFERSNRWPLKLDVIQKTKSSFLCLLARLINQEWSGYSAMILAPSDNHDQESIFASAKLEIISPCGLVFCLQINHETELALLRKELHSPKTPQKRKEFLRFAVEAFERELISRPLHNQMIQAAVHEMPHLSTTIRLAKRWLSAHWINIDDELVELLCKAVFSSKSIPNSAFQGWVAFLELLSAWDFKTSPLVVPMDSGEISSDRMELIQKSFEEWRAKDIMGQKNALYIVPYLNTTVDDLDWDRPIWSTHVSRTILFRIKSLAKMSLNRLQSTMDDFCIKSLFKHTSKAYDVVLELNPKFCARSFENLHAPMKMQQEIFKNQPGVRVINFDPVDLFIQDLQELFGSFAAFFWDRYGGSEIGISFNPRSSKIPVPFKASVDYPFILVKEKEKLFTRVDVKEVLFQIAKVGKGIIKSIHLNDKFKVE